MKTKMFTFALIALMIGGLSSCIVVEDDHSYYGPAGQEGKAFFGIDYDYYAPYSYWDNNPSVPIDPFFGEYYRTWPGVYEFEYAINSWEYWYGTYEIYTNPGSPGGPNGQPGFDGADTYLLLICNHNGFYFEGWEDCTCTRSIADDGTITVEANEGDKHYKIIMKKTTVNERPMQPAKYSFK